ncbi:hypothetical protein [Sporosarcina sp. P17b]|uniref:magnesium chelatase subunit ChlI family protein n=1 Tax=Sporosarcina sp. P17b TaxID=2048260 RepID=UPI000C170AA2|nr:hypothetical protein [Sporosarcina sp. P17b]PIC74209.1 hypothetical protein CSV76_06880 [Sporosarcina sp. P17b]
MNVVELHPSFDSENTRTPTYAVCNDLRNGKVSFQQLEQTARFTAGQLNIIGDVCFERKWSNRTQVKLIRITCTISDLQGRRDISMEALEEALVWKKLPTSLQSIGGVGAIQM